MKKSIFLILMVVSFISCRQEPTTGPGYGRGQSLRRTKTETFEKYHKGDVVYLKPDSIKAVILRREKCGCNEVNYLVNYFDSRQDIHQISVQETSIY
jgi:hypothetical protein